MELKRKVSALVFAGALMVGATAQAQEADYKTQMAEAAELTQVNLDDAVQRYLEIRATVARPEVDYSLGRTYQKSFQCKAAQHYYTQVMVSYDLPDSNQIYSRAVKDYDDISACEAWQTINVNCTMSTGDKFVIDDSQIGSCMGKSFSLPDGEHTLKLVSKEGKEVEVKVTAQAGQAPKTVDVAFPPEKEIVEVVSEDACKDLAQDSKHYEYREKFHPALYWSLISGGVLFLAGSGWMGALANNSLVDVQKYEDLYLVSNEGSKQGYKDKANSARDDVDLYNILMYSSIGLGGALLVTGITLAIISAVSPKEEHEISPVSISISPSRDGAMMGLGLVF